MHSSAIYSQARSARRHLFLYPSPSRRVGQVSAKKQLEDIRPSSVRWVPNTKTRPAGGHSRSDRCSRCDLRDATRGDRAAPRSAKVSIFALEPAGASVWRNSALSVGLKSSSWPHSKIASNTFRIEIKLPITNRLGSPARNGAFHSYRNRRLESDPTTPWIASGVDSTLLG